MPPIWTGVFCLWVAAAPLAANDTGPVPPCAGESVLPAFPPLGAPLASRVWQADDLAGTWTPPACLDWKEGPVTSLVASAGRFEAPGGMDEIVGRLGRISAMRNIRYWSDSRTAWHLLFEDAAALTAPKRDSRRDDFELDELQPGADMYFWQDEDHVMRGLVYRLRIVERTADRLVFETENVDPMGVAFLDLVDPGQFRQRYVLEYEDGNVWRYYGLARLGEAAALAVMSRQSLMNRATAYFRYVAGIPTDKEPPAAP